VNARRNVSLKIIVRFLSLLNSLIEINIYVVVYCAKGKVMVFVHLVRNFCWINQGFRHVTLCVFAENRYVVRGTRNKLVIKYQIARSTSIVGNGNRFVESWITADAKICAACQRRQKLVVLSLVMPIKLFQLEFGHKITTHKSFQMCLKNIYLSTNNQNLFPASNLYLKSKWTFEVVIKGWGNVCTEWWAPHHLGIINPVRP